MRDFSVEKVNVRVVESEATIYGYNKGEKFASVVIIVIYQVI